MRLYSHRRSAGFYCYSTCASPSTHKAADKFMYWYCLSCVCVFWVWGGNGPMKVKTAVEPCRDKSCLPLSFYWTFISCRLVQVRSGVSRTPAACDRDKEPTDLNAPPGFTWLLNILKRSVCVVCVGFILWMMNSVLNMKGTTVSPNPLLCQSVEFVQLEDDSLLLLLDVM